MQDELVSRLEPIQLENQIVFGLVFSNKCVVLCVYDWAYVWMGKPYSQYI